MERPRSVDLYGIGVAPRWSLSGRRTYDPQSVSPAELAAEFHQLRELAPAFGVRTLRQSIERTAAAAMECGDDETRDLAEQLLKEVRKLRFP